MVFLQAVHQVPDAGLVALVAVDYSVVVEHTDFVQQRHQLFPDLRVAQDIVEHVNPERSDLRVRGQVHHHPADQRDLLRLRGDPLCDRIQPEVVPALLRDLPIGHLVLPGEQNAQFFLLHRLRPFGYPAGFYLRAL